MRYPEKWWIGAPVIGLLAFFAAESLAPRIEAELGAQLMSRLAGQSALRGGAVTVKGRDAKLDGVVLNEAEKSSLIATLRGTEALRSLVDATREMRVASPFVLALERNGRHIEVSGVMPLGFDSTPVKEWAAPCLTSEFSPADLTAGSKVDFARGEPKNFLALLKFAAERICALDPGKAVISDSTLDIAGVARSDEDFDAALSARQFAPSGASVARFEIAPPRASPFIYSAALHGGMLTLSGHAPSAEIRAALAEKAKAAAHGGAVSDASRIGSGAAEGFPAAASAALVAIGALEDGQATVTGAKLDISGRGRPNMNAAAIDTLVKAQLPNGFEIGAIDVVAGPIASKSGRLDAEQCRKELADILARGEIAFASDETLAPSAKPALDQLAGVALRCGGVSMEVVVHNGTPGIEELNRAIAKLRAQLIVDHMVKAGIDEETVAARGEARGPSSDGAGAPDRIEIVVKDPLVKTE